MRPVLLKSGCHRMHHLLRFQPVPSSLQHNDRLMFTSRLNLTLPSSFCTAFPLLALVPHRVRVPLLSNGKASRKIKVYLFQSKAHSPCEWRKQTSPYSRLFPAYHTATALLGHKEETISFTRKTENGGHCVNGC